MASERPSIRLSNGRILIATKTPSGMTPNNTQGQVMTNQTPIAALANLELTADTELEKVLRIAAHVGDISRDQVNVGYTSLLIGLLWSDDPTSLWIQQEQASRGVRLDAVFQQRNLKGSEKDDVLSKVKSGAPFAMRTDPFSISARTVLRDARSIATESGRSRSEPIGTRHVAGAYFFRNPPGHNRQFHVEWRFEPEPWRKAFAAFIARQYPAEIRAWAPVLGTYLSAEPVSEVIPGTVLAGYTFDRDALAILRTAEKRAVSAPQSLMASEDLLRILVSAKRLPDCVSFAELVGDRFGAAEPIDLVEADPFGEKGGSAGATQGFKNILDRARTLTFAITTTEVIGARHLIASLIIAPDSTANRQLASGGVSLPFLRLKLLNEFTRRWLDDDGVQWRFHLVGTTPPTIAGFSSDQAERGDDKLDVSRFATAFAVVLAADSVSPPLSIGVFGDWGSGKSFFMRLMSQATEQLSGIETTGADGRRLFCRRVVPIRFNAWHYAEHDLWASLVQTIFRELRTALVGNDDESELMETVLNRLELARFARQDAQEQVKQAQAKRNQSRRHLDDARAEAARKAATTVKVKTTDVIAAVRKTVVTEQRFDNAVTVAETYLHVSGFGALAKEGQKSGAEMMDFVDQTRLVARRTQSAFEWLVRAPVKWPEILMLCGVSAVVLGIGGIVAIRYRAEIGGAWPMISAGIVEVLTVAGLVTTWAKKHLGTVSRGLDEFDALRAEIDRKVEDERAVQGKDVEAAEQDAARADAVVKEAETELQKADDEVLRSEQQVKESRSLNRIAKLVEQRLTGRNYEQYLGIIDAIRKDFQSLSRLMKDMREQNQPMSDGLQPIDRIVLYIDDLDRCPSEQVVAVLEAIHLLLSFELFVVVVGVDVRWAARSLAERYPRHLATGRYEGEDTQTGPANKVVRDGATALDYLEKIFQIPFWLPPMDEQASRNMIADLLPRPREQAVVVTSDPAGGAPAVGETAPMQGQTRNQTAALVGPTVSRTKAEALVIEPAERAFLLSLAGAVGKSPRRLKRFVNTYRILKGSIDALERETFVLDHGNAGEYRAAATLLALITGAPDSCLALMPELAQRTDDQKLQEFVVQAQPLVAPNEAVYADAALGAYTSAVNDPELKVRDLRHWMPQVMRFSFRSGRN